MSGQWLLFSCWREVWDLSSKSSLLAPRVMQWSRHDSLRLLKSFQKVIATINYKLNIFTARKIETNFKRRCWHFLKSLLGCHSWVMSCWKRKFYFNDYDVKICILGKFQQWCVKFWIKVIIFLDWGSIRNNVTKKMNNMT